VDKNEIKKLQDKQGEILIELFKAKDIDTMKDVITRLDKVSGKLDRIFERIIKDAK
jgi:tRNA(Ser,Leu) C12 N-acetylase TAN1